MADQESESTGRISFRIKREMSVERALSKIRHHLGGDRLALSNEDTAALSWLLGRMWAHMDFSAWEKMGLDAITLERVEQLVAITNMMQTKTIAESEGIKQAGDILGSL